MKISFSRDDIDCYIGNNVWEDLSASTFKVRFVVYPKYTGNKLLQNGFF
jgi:hypothetical protein